MSATKNKVIEKLEKKVAKAETKGNFNSAHHRVLANYKKRKPAASVSRRNAESEGDKE